MVEVDEIPSKSKSKGSQPEFTLQKLNHLIKGQLKFLLLPDDVSKSKYSGDQELDHPQTQFTSPDSLRLRPTSLSQISQESNSCEKCEHYRNCDDIDPQNYNNNCPNHTQDPNSFYSKPKSKSKATNNYLPPKNASKSGTNNSKFPLFLSLLEILLSNLFMLSILPVVLPLILLNFLLRFFINSYHKLITDRDPLSPKTRLMKGEDAFWASESPYNPGNFTSLYIIEGVPSLEKIRQKLNSSWVERKDKKGRPMFTKLKLKAVQHCNYFAWELDKEFDLNSHIRYFHPEDPQRPIKEQELFEEIRKIYDNILPDHKPQWEILLVPNYIYNEPKLQLKKHYAIIFRIHHSIMDGLSAAQALRLVVADNVVEAGVDPMKELRAPFYMKVVTYFLALILTSRYILRHNYFKKESNPFHGPCLKGPKTLGWSRPIRLNAVKKIKASTNTSVTAIFVSAIGGAFRNLNFHKNLKRRSQHLDIIPIDKITAVTCAALIPYPNIKAQNRFCVLFTPIDAKEPDSFKRVKKSQELFENRLVGAAEVVMAYWITWIGGCFPIKVLNWLQDGICHGTVLLSNLPGPLTTTQIFGGDPIVDIVGWSPIRNRIGIAMCLFGYNGRLRANVIADSSVFPDEDDVRNLITEFENEILVLGKGIGLREQDCFTEDNVNLNTNDHYRLSSLTLSK